MLGRLLLLLICLFLCLYRPTLVRADFTAKLSQQINLIDQEYSTDGSTQPTDNGLGLIFWDDDRYTTPTVYFEAIIRCDACSGGNNQVTAALYTVGGAAVSGADVSYDQSGYTRVRTASAVSLTDDQEYTVRLSRDADTGTAYIKTARLIINQNSTNLTATQTQVEIGNADTTTATSYEIMTAPKIFRFDDDVYDPLTAVYFEATLVGSDGSATAYASLSAASDCASTVTDSEVSVTGTTWDRVRTNDLKANLSDDTDYWVCLKTTSGDTGSMATAKLAINQSDTDGLMRVQLYHHFNQTLATDADTTYTSQDYPNEYDPSLFEADELAVYLELSLSTSAGTGYGRLYNVSDNTALTSTELTSDTPGFTRVRSSSPINTSLPAEAKDLDLQLKNSATNTTSATTGWLILDVIRYPDPELSFAWTGVAASQTHNGITTSIESTISTLPFDLLAPGTPKYAAHALTAATNAASGYAVTLKLTNYLQGNYPANNIDPFSATWSSPQTWSSPTGTTANDNTGWIGANTSDTRLPAWSDAAAKFAGLGGSEYTVMAASGVDSGTTIYVSYALEVNVVQPPDEYSGSLLYNLLPTY
ncbi:hypothetical protein A2W24_02300 [Microgenomates group bacterium RBG_16_45_19]|nr:MAG: hypothetical protein A2W24_02300 [Microgenomates group bacterium RBG_16_45_19]